MDSEFPTPEEEYELLHQHEFQVLREIEELERKKQSQQTKSTDNSQKKNEEQAKVDVYTAVANTSVQHNGNSLAENAKKRSYDELFGDISDIADIDNCVGIQEPREKKPRWDQPEEIIKLVIDAREKFHEDNSGSSIKKQNWAKKKDSISLRVPSWNFVALTRRSDAQRIYVRMKNDDHKAQKNMSPISNLLSVPYSQLKSQADEIIINNVKRASCAPTNPDISDVVNNDELWVDKYRPRTYLELLSDESVNRHLLHWIKLWDKVVFNKNFVRNKKKKQQPFFKNKNFTEEKEFEEVDSNGFPIQRVVLLSGPPGLGKTTLAHLAAKHAGYNVVEINASDERSPDAFRQVLLSSTQMRAVMGNDPRPNCLVLDEIDGAPAASIDLLLKFIQGKLVPKGKKDKAKTEKPKNACHRPVICICNEPYTPSLRSLRAVALIIPVPEVSPTRLADRLMEISQKEGLKSSPDKLLKLAEISGCDIRSCLGALQYMGKAKLSDDFSFALKNSQKGLFDSWKQILTIPVNRAGMVPVPERVRSVLRTVQNGESEKLAQGIFHNYPAICNEKLQQLYKSLEWFQFFDEILSVVRSSQVWSVMPYTNFAFVTWHLYFAKTRNVKLSYPSIITEVNQKLARSRGILTAVQRSCGRDIITLAVDIAPFLPDILSPRLRTVSGHLHSSKEKSDIIQLVNILLEFGLTYIQERSIDGVYEYKLDPNIFEVGIFPDCKVRRMLVYAVKQIIAQELEAERLRRISNVTGNQKNTQNVTDTASKEGATKSAKQDTDSKAQSSKVPNPVERSKDIEAKLKEIQYKDFFGRPIVVNHEKQQSSSNDSTKIRDLLTKHGVWYKYKEGFSNAVRRNVLMQELI